VASDKTPVSAGGGRARSWSTGLKGGDGGPPAGRPGDRALRRTEGPTDGRDVLRPPANGSETANAHAGCVDIRRRMRAAVVGSEQRSALVECGSTLSTRGPSSG